MIPRIGELERAACHSEIQESSSKTRRAMGQRMVEVLGQEVQNLKPTENWTGELKRPGRQQVAEADWVFCRSFKFPMASGPGTHTIPDSAPAVLSHPPVPPAIAAVNDHSSVGHSHIPVTAPAQIESVRHQFEEDPPPYPGDLAPAEERRTPVLTITPPEEIEEIPVDARTVQANTIDEAVASFHEAVGQSIRPNPSPSPSSILSLDGVNLRSDAQEAAHGTGQTTSSNDAEGLDAAHVSVVASRIPVESSSRSDEDRDQVEDGEEVIAPMDDVDLS